MNSRLIRHIATLGTAIALCSLAGCGVESTAHYATEQVESKAAEYYNANEYSESARWFRAAASRGSASAQTMLGEMYRTGTGVERDDFLARRWFRKAGEQGNVKAQMLLGNMYRYGNGASRDNAKALLWFSRASDQGNADAQYELGMMYQEGAGVKRDYTRASDWFSVSAGQGNHRAKGILKENLAEGRAGKVVEVSGVTLGMTASQVERRLGEFDLIAPAKALVKRMSGGLVSIERLEPEYVDTGYVAVNQETGAGLGFAPGVNQRSGQFQFNKPVFQKDGFKFWSLSFTRKELGHKLFAMEASREFDTQPDWDAVYGKLVEKYGKPDRENMNLSQTWSEFANGKATRQYLWGDCKNISKTLDMSKCEGSAILVSFEEGKELLSDKYKAGIMMMFFDGKLSHENERAVKKAKEAKKQAT
jgi:hypothetical protein